jgi:NifU-like protein
MKFGSANATGTAAAIECGTYVKFYLELDGGKKIVERVEFRSNGCGFMVAAADVVADLVRGKRLTELHGLGQAMIVSGIEVSLGAFPKVREHCLATCIEALRAAFEDLRARQIEEFAGEKALICTCFGVSEESLSLLISQIANITVEQVGERCNAGTGCGSCQSIIQELLDLARREHL